MYHQTEIIADMKKIGLSEYECKAYLALLEEYPLNGYALSKHSGIPRSRIYEVLKNLMNKQMVFEQIGEKKKINYYPVDPELFMKKLQGQYEEILFRVSRYTAKLYREEQVDEKLVVIEGRRNIIRFINQMINGAEKRIALSIWEQELRELTKALDSAIVKGVVLRGIFFGKNNPYETLVPHRRMKRYIAEKKERYLSIVIDGTHTISGVVSRGQNSKVTWTRDEGFVEVSEDYIAHDLVVNLYSASLGKQQYARFEDFADNVHSRFFHYSEAELAAYKKMK